MSATIRHLPVTVAQRVVGIALQHSQVTADDRDWSAKFVHGQRKQLCVGLC
jgi:hypothetical protein